MQLAKNRFRCEFRGNLHLAADDMFFNLFFAHNVLPSIPFRCKPLYWLRFCTKETLTTEGSSATVFTEKPHTISTYDAPGRVRVWTKNEPKRGTAASFSASTSPRYVRLRKPTAVGNTNVNFLISDPNL